MFMGEYRPSLDEKGRVAIPVKLRKAFGEGSIIETLVVAPGFDRCIMAFRETDWRQFVENKLAPLSQADPKNRMRTRFLLGGATVCELDKQGRILVPANLKEYAAISKEVAIIGVCDRIEIWSVDAYDAYKPDGDALEEFASELGF
jgi:MraZ protein